MNKMPEEETIGLDLTEEERMAVEEAGYGGVSQDIPQNVHTFLHNVAVTTDTTKLGYLKEEELGFPNLPIRTYKELALFCDKVADMPIFNEYFNSMSEIVTSTSLSKDAKLLELAVINRREVADVTKKPRKENKGWFKPKTTTETTEMV